MRTKVTLLLSAVVATNASYTVLIPFVPELMHRAHLGAFGIALAFALFAGAKALCQPLGGACGDAWGARWVAFTALLIVAVAVVAFASATSEPVLLLARSAWGAGEGLLTPAVYQGATMLGRRYGIPSTRTTGWIGTASVVGLLVGPAAAVIGGPLGLTTLCLIGAGVQVVMALGLLIAMTGPREIASPAAPPVVEPDEPAGASGPSSWIVPVLTFAGLDLVAGFGYSALEPTIPKYASATGGATLTIASVFAVGFAVFAVVSALLARFAEELSLRTLAAGGVLLGAAGLAAMSLSSNGIALTGCMVVIMTGQPMIYLAARRGIADLRTAEGRLGRSFGLFGAVSDIGELLGPVAGGAAVALAGRYGFVLLGLLTLIPLPVLIRIHVGSKRDSRELVSA